MSQTTLEITTTTYMVVPVGSFEWLVLAVNFTANEPEEARYLTDHFGPSALPVGFNPSNVVGRLEIWRDYRGKDWDEYLRGENLYVAPEHRRAASQHSSAKRS